MNKIGIVGLGLGYSLAHYLAYKDYDIVGVDIRRESWEKPRIDARMKSFLDANSDMYNPPVFTTDFDELSDREQIMIFVSTPFDRVRNRLSIRNVVSALDSSIKINRNAIYQILSTLPVGGWNFLRNFSVEMYYTPPMVKREDFIGTFKNPPGGVQMIGYEESGKRLTQLIKFYKDRHLLDMSVKIVQERAQIIEKAKLLINVMLSARIITANAIRDWVDDEMDADSICNVVASDRRIGDAYFTPGGPAAGPCFPRDLLELESASTNTDLEKFLKVINSINGTERWLDI